MIFSYLVFSQLTIIKTSLAQTFRSIKFLSIYAYYALLNTFKLIFRNSLMAGFQVNPSFLQAMVKTVFKLNNFMKIIELHFFGLKKRDTISIKIKV